MVFKSIGYNSSGDYSPRPAYTPPPQPTPSSSYQTQQKSQQGKLIASVGRERILSVERIYNIDNDLLGYNLSGGKVLLRVPKNDKKFDHFISLPFTKGVTERETGRTMLILGSNAHHVEAMQSQFEGVLWTKNDEEEVKRFGNTIRWINVGDTKNGFVGIDYNQQAPEDAGVARTSKDIQFLASTLLDYGYDAQKRLFILKPPYIQERPEGKALRREGLEHLTQIAKADTSRLSKLLRDKSFDIEIEEVKA
ncbi:MAG: hypothetical protein AABY00_02765 [Nanoarchaeota archaeon]